MITVIEDQKSLGDACRALCAKDPLFADMYSRYGLPELRLQDAGFEALLYIITEQMISLTAAAAIWQRFKLQLAPLTPEKLAGLELEVLQSGGQSRAKAATIKALSLAVASGELDLAHLETLEDDAARGQLLAIKGIGNWTADVYLLSCLGRVDVWPAGDVALQTAVADVMQLVPRPNNKQMMALAENWRPWRAIAARYFWYHYRVMKQQATR